MTPVLVVLCAFVAGIQCANINGISMTSFDGNTDRPDASGSGGAMKLGHSYDRHEFNTDKYKGGPAPHSPPSSHAPANPANVNHSPAGGHVPAAGSAAPGNSAPHAGGTPAQGGQAAASLGAQPQPSVTPTSNQPGVPLDNNGVIHGTNQHGNAMGSHAIISDSVDVPNTASGPSGFGGPHQTGGANHPSAAGNAGHGADHGQFGNGNNPASGANHGGLQPGQGGSNSPNHGAAGHSPGGSGAVGANHQPGVHPSQSSSGGAGMNHQSGAHPNQNSGGTGAIHASSNTQFVNSDPAHSQAMFQYQQALWKQFFTIAGILINQAGISTPQLPAVIASLGPPQTANGPAPVTDAGTQSPHASSDHASTGIQNVPNQGQGQAPASTPPRTPSSASRLSDFEWFQNHQRNPSNGRPATPPNGQQTIGSDGRRGCVLGTATFPEGREIRHGVYFLRCIGNQMVPVKCSTIAGEEKTAGQTWLDGSHFFECRQVGPRVVLRPLSRPDGPSAGALNAAAIQGGVAPNTAGNDNTAGSWNSRNTFNTNGAAQKFQTHIFNGKFHNV